MHCNVWRDNSLCGTNLCDLSLTHIICINLTHKNVALLYYCMISLSLSLSLSLSFSLTTLQIGGERCRR